LFDFPRGSWDASGLSRGMRCHVADRDSVSHMNARLKRNITMIWHVPKDFDFEDNLVIR